DSIGSVRTKILLGFLAGAVLTVAVGVQGLVDRSSMTGQAAKVHDEVTGPVYLIGQVASGARDAKIGTYDLVGSLLLDTGTSTDELMEKFQASVEQTNGYATELAAIDLDQEAAALRWSALQAWDAYHEQLNDIVLPAFESGDTAAFLEANTAATESFESLTAAVAELEANQLATGEAAVADVESANDRG